jgi:hypothetical protein
VQQFLSKFQVNFKKMVSFVKKFKIVRSNFTNISLLTPQSFINTSLNIVHSEELCIFKYQTNK